MGKAVDSAESAYYAKIMLQVTQRHVFGYLYSEHDKVRVVCVICGNKNNARIA